MFKKFLFPVFLFIVLAIISGCVVNKKNNQAEQNKATKKISGRLFATSYLTNDIAYGKIDTSDWQTYQNKKIGFEIKFPPKALPYRYAWDGNNNKCADNSEKDYLIPYKVFAYGNDIYIREEYYYKVNSDGRCQKIINSFDSTHKEENGLITPWHIIAKQINEEEIGNFIKSKFGSSCDYKKENADNENEYNIIILGDNKDLSNSKCPVNYDVYIKYNAKKNLLIYWNTGQECIIGVKYPKCYDEEIIKSFKFL